MGTALASGLYPDVTCCCWSVDWWRDICWWYPINWKLVILCQFRTEGKKNMNIQIYFTQKCEKGEYQPVRWEGVKCKLIAVGKARLHEPPTRQPRMESLSETQVTMLANAVSVVTWRAEKSTLWAKVKMLYSHDIHHCGCSGTVVVTASLPGSFRKLLHPFIAVEWGDKVHWTSLCQHKSSTSQLELGD